MALTYTNIRAQDTFTTLAAGQSLATDANWTEYFLTGAGYEIDEAADTASVVGTSLGGGGRRHIVGYTATAPPATDGYGASAEWGGHSVATRRYWIGPAVRVNDVGANWDCYILVLYWATGTGVWTLNIFKYVNGAYIGSLASAALALNTGDWVTLETETDGVGDINLRSYHNGNLKSSVTDGAADKITPIGVAGLGSISSGTGSGNPLPKITDWILYDAVVPPPAPTVAGSSPTSILAFPETCDDEFTNVLRIPPPDFNLVDDCDIDEPPDPIYQSTVYTHPLIFVPNLGPQQSLSATNDPSGKFCDAYKELWQVDWQHKFTNLPHGFDGSWIISMEVAEQFYSGLSWTPALPKVMTFCWLIGFELMVYISSGNSSHQIANFDYRILNKTSTVASSGASGEIRDTLTTHNAPQTYWRQVGNGGLQEGPNIWMRPDDEFLVQVKPKWFPTQSSSANISLAVKSWIEFEEQTCFKVTGTGVDASGTSVNGEYCRYTAYGGYPQYKSKGGKFYIYRGYIAPNYYWMISDTPGGAVNALVGATAPTGVVIIGSYPALGTYGGTATVARCT